MKPLHSIRLTTQAASILAHPLRLRILRLARERPRSASELARTLDLPRQRINYHVRQLADAGLLTPAGQQRRRNMVEQQYAASAEAYAFSPELLSEVALAPDPEADPTSAAHLVAVCARAEAEVAELIDSAAVAGVRVRTFSLEQELEFGSAEERVAFLAELRTAIEAVTARYQAATGGSSRRFRVVVGSYPIPAQRVEGTTPAASQ